MLPYHIDVDAACEIGEGYAQCVGGDGIDHFFAMHAFIKSHLFFIGWSLADSAGLIRFLPSDVES